MGDESEKNITLSKDAVYGGVIIILVALLVLSVFTHGFGLIAQTYQCPENESTEQPVLNNTNGTTVVVPVQNDTEEGFTELTVGIGDLPVLGEETAVVTWVEFSDYQCPFCSKLYKEAEADVTTNYIDTGKVKLYFRDFPLSFHPHSLPAAVATRCADDQGKFWEMHGKLFDTQSSWTGLGSVDDTFKGYAVDLGLDNDTFSTCYDNAEHIDEISVDFAEAQEYGVRGTPSNFLIIPKDKVSEDDIVAAVDSLNEMYGDGIQLFEDGNSYTVFIPGAYPYSTFDTVLSTVNY
ncbi:DsbA family protein [Candidatus Micrarchaeota archaeon]|nr:DsbA family protein [Candidatus Micrarchaeota archaeon]